MFNPSQLRLARKRRELTLTKLADLSGVSLRSLTSYENGWKSPNRENLEKLASTLEVPSKFFARETVEAIPVAAASFRKLSKTSAARRDAVLANAGLTVQFFAAISTRFHLPEPSIPSLDKLGPADAAEVVRHLWELGDRPIPNMIHLLEAKGVRVAALSQQYADIDAFCFFRDGIPYVFLNTSRSAERQRFDAAHELGHLVLHGEQDMELSSSKEREAQANEFAANFLMPSSRVLSQSMQAASIARILAARTFWKVSAMAMTHRLHELCLLSNWQYRSACMELSDRGYRSSEPGGIAAESSQLLRKVMFGSENKVTVSNAAEILDLHAKDVVEFIHDLVPTAVYK